MFIIIACHYRYDGSLFYYVVYVFFLYMIFISCCSFEFVEP
jgi:hypothetical protein